MCHKLWEPSECSKSSTYLERACSHCFCSRVFCANFGRFTDSQTAARIIEVGYMKLDLHKLAFKIFQVCAEHSIRLEMLFVIIGIGIN